MLYKQCITESIKSVFRIDLPEGGETMSEVRVKDNESLDSALRRFVNVLSQVSCLKSESVSTMKSQA